VVKEFFGSSQLSQFMDQTNPLSEVTHKRRLSALGPGGLTRERAGFEVRDVHPTHYGRICPIETPEGPNIGLIASLSTFARVNEFGFIETPYRKVDGARRVEGGQVLRRALQTEEGNTRHRPGERLDEPDCFVATSCRARRGGDFVMVPPRRRDADGRVAEPARVSSLPRSSRSSRTTTRTARSWARTCSARPCRSSAPRRRSSAPGIERVVARDSGVTVVAKRDGIVESVDASRIVIRPTRRARRTTTRRDVDIYNLVKFQRSNQNTCINQKPIVPRVTSVRKGDVIADGPATELR
jgi:DNA-directed RNA polymerase subunit beta